MDDNGDSKPDSTSGSFPGAAMDLDFMDELLDDGCWLETTDGFSFSHPGSLATSSSTKPLMESGTSLLNTNPHQQIHQKSAENNSEKEISRNHLVGGDTTASSGQSDNFPGEGGEVSNILWIAPKAARGPSSSVRQRLIDAIAHLKQYTKESEVLVQIWVPTKKEGKRVLTTIDQPCFLSLRSESLACYRYVSENYHFLVEGDSKDFLGLPGRVFLGKLPESTPDVRFFRTEEYPRKSYAKQYNIRGSLAVPIFERVTKTCLGVVEVVTTSQNISYRPELETICKALEAFDLRSSDDFCPPSVKACKEFCQAAVPEISEILGSVCRKHKLPLALTWARCFQQGKGGCQHFDEKFANCISTVDSACYVADRDLYAFHVACSELYLNLGQGIVGRAFVTNKQCFATEITAFSKTDYPLSHHAKLLDLHAAVAIPLQSTYGGSVDFVLELFLPKDCRNTEEQKQIWDLLPTAIQEACQNLQVVMEKDLEENISWKMSMTSDGRHNKQVSPNFSSSMKEPSPEGSSWISQMIEAQQKGKNVCLSWDNPQDPKEKFKVATNWDNPLDEFCHNQGSDESGSVLQNSTPKDNIDAGKSPLAGLHLSGSKKVGEKRRTKAEKTISLEVLRQYFAGSLKDAAKSIGVCPTTLKRICRQHGITRWPSRKLKKVGHSLKKLQLVIDSVQGAEGAIQIGSFYTTFPELTSPNFGANSPVTSTRVNDDSKPLNSHPENGFNNLGATTLKSPSSSCSQSSGSSISCSTGDKHKITNAADGLAVEDPDGALKRTRSDAELHTLQREESKPLARSQSHKILAAHPSAETHPPFSKGGGRSSRENGTFRVKANFGEDKVRFSLQPSWDFKDLLLEIAKRFGIQDISRVDLKYLDDDHDWVLLTCDADLEECKDIYRVSQSSTVKISVHQGSQPPGQLGADK